MNPALIPQRELNLHVLDSHVLQDLAIVDVPHGLIVPDFGGQQDGAQDDSPPVTWTDADLCVGEEPLQVDLVQRKVSIRRSLCVCVWRQL